MIIDSWRNLPFREPQSRDSHCHPSLRRSAISYRVNSSGDFMEPFPSLIIGIIARVPVEPFEDYSAICAYGISGHIAKQVTLRPFASVESAPI